MRIDGIEYNIIQYISDELGEESAADIIVGGFDVRNKEDVTCLTLTGGTKQNDAYALANPLIEIAVRNKSSEKARSRIFELFNLLDNKFGLTLPEYDDGSYQFDAVIVPQISAMQIPNYVGADNNYMHNWTVDLRLTGVLEH